MIGSPKTVQKYTISTSFASIFSFINRKSRSLQSKQHKTLQKSACFCVTDKT